MRYTIEKAWWRTESAMDVWARGWAIRLHAEDGTESVVRYCLTATEAHDLVAKWNKDDQDEA